MIDAIHYSIFITDILDAYPFLWPVFAIIVVVVLYLFGGGTTGGGDGGGGGGSGGGC